MLDFFTQPKGSEDIYNDKQFACYVVIFTIYFNTPLEKYFDSTTGIDGVFKDRIFA